MYSTDISMYGGTHGYNTDVSMYRVHTTHRFSTDISMYRVTHYAQVR